MCSKNSIYTRTNSIIYSFNIIICANFISNYHIRRHCPYSNFHT